MIKKDFLLLFVFSLLIRLALFLMIYSQPIKFYGNSDAYNYEQIALNLIQSGDFSDEAEPPLTPNLYRTPAYPLFIAGIYSLTNKSALAVILAQILIGSLASALIPILANSLSLSRRVGWLAGLLLALDPLIILTTYQMMSETVFTGFLVVATIMLALYFRTRNICWLAGSAVMLALTSLTRPISQYLAFALIPLFFISMERAQWRWIWKNILLFLVVSLTITYSWAYRNYSEADIWTLSASGDKNLIYYRARSVLAEGKNISEQEAAAELVQYIQSEVKTHNLTSAQEIHLMRAKAMEIFRQYPMATLKVHAKGFVEVLANPGLNLFCTMLDNGEVRLDDAKNIIGCMSNNNGDFMTLARDKFDKMNWLEKLVSFLEIALLAGIYFGTALGTWKLVRSRQWYLLYFLCILIVYFPILSAGGGTGARFRIPIVPFLAIMAGIGFSRFHALTEKG
jgi:4-amino-4-deoxy-L-arabinose transferase-like glycosyltransferase